MASEEVRKLVEMFDADRVWSAFEKVAGFPATWDPETKTVIEVLSFLRKDCSNG